MRRKTVKKSDTPTPRKKKKVVNPRVVREYCGGTMTKSAFFGAIRAFLRQRWLYSCPFRKEILKRAYSALLKKWQCNDCKKMFLKKEVEVNHIEPCGSLRDYHEIKAFHDRLFVEDISKLEVLCKDCHKKFTEKSKITIDI
jgi:ribosomal protein L37AE/L43A